MPHPHPHRPAKNNRRRPNPHRHTASAPRADKGQGLSPAPTRPRSIDDPATLRRTRYDYARLSYQALEGSAQSISLSYEIDEGHHPQAKIAIAPVALHLPSRAMPQRLTRPTQRHTSYRRASSTPVVCCEVPAPTSAPAAYWPYTKS
jgi:hypothetical protein